ncbi:Prenyltransferase/squalene oxidase [Kalmanozyma brasiliensis GHG001]|uniref:Geranylgeranyl transferase type-1 subunit beta n=1 Tax=Kalmanozyma brasiliensis (strain GHG001) TaxID=1365824 RepID=V5F1W3_KALBG|nr:Prenyltransferase/squalene oxidase [Kalmanozyma brasiliensis GHG001]EST09334.1 Prenyltransferase/squalene oxidase [Kalmanozyma brasiliensis GHG001]
MSPTPQQQLTSAFETKKHISFLLRCLRLLPQPYTSADDQRMTLGYFAVSGLDLLDSTSKIPLDEKAELIEWVYDQQLPTGGFRGSPSTGPSSSRFAGANVAMTYAALLILAVLKDDFARLDRDGLLRFVGALQDRGGGGFAAEEQTGEDGVVDRDPRFTYCAVTICSMLGEWGNVDVGKAREYLEGCQRYDGGFGASSVHEAHSGMTYCCIAALHLLPQDETTARWGREEEALAWLAHRQVAPSEEAAMTTQAQDVAEVSDEEEAELAGGFQGRPNKLPPDVCYSFWNGAALSLLGQHDLVDAVADAGYVLSAQSRVGGIAKIPNEHPDLLHTYLGLASLSLHQPDEDGSGNAEDGDGIDFGVKRLDAAWNCSLGANEWLREHLTKQ